MKVALKVVVVGAVLLIIGGSLAFLLTDSSGKFGQSAISEVEKSKCENQEYEFNQGDISQDELDPDCAQHFEDQNTQEAALGATLPQQIN